jgi:hypothetical protein
MDNITDSLFTNRRIVLVGNSKALIGNGLGKFIDSHDTVVRFNMGIPWGYEEDVGKRIDVWATAFKGRKEKQFVAEFYLRQRQCTIWIDYKCKDPIPKLYSNDKHILTVPEKTIAEFMVLYNYDEDFQEDTIIEYFRKTSGIKRPSAGLSTLYYISKHFDYKWINIVGFDCFEIRTNYWKDLSNYCNENFHPSDKEKKFLEYILSENKNMSWIQ